MILRSKRQSACAALLALSATVSADAHDAIAQPISDDALVGAWQCRTGDETTQLDARLDLRADGAYDGDIHLTASANGQYLDYTVVHSGDWRTEGETFIYVADQMALDRFDSSPDLAGFSTDIEQIIARDVARPQEFKVANYTGAAMTLIDPVGESFACARQ